MPEIECTIDFLTIKKNDMTNWTNIYHRWHLPLQSLAFSLLKDKTFAQDIVHDIFLHLLEKKIPPLFIRYAEAYLKTAVYHRCITLIRKKKQTLSIDQWHEAFHPSANSAEQPVLYRELTQQHFAAIHQLPCREKEIYILTHIGGYKRKELVHLFGSSANTIKQQMQVASKKVRQEVNALCA